MKIDLASQEPARAYRTYARAYRACERALGRVPDDWQTLAVISPSWRMTLEG